MFAPARENANHFTRNLIIKTPTLQKKENSYQGDAIMKSRQQAAPVYALIHFLCVCVCERNPMNLHSSFTVMAII